MSLMLTVLNIVYLIALRAWEIDFDHPERDAVRISIFLIINLMWIVVFGFDKLTTKVWRVSFKTNARYNPAWMELQFQHYRRVGEQEMPFITCCSHRQLMKAIKKLDEFNITQLDIQLVG